MPYSDTLTAPSSGPIYFIINTIADGQTINTAVQTIDVTAPTE